MDAIDIFLENCRGISKLKTQEISFRDKKACLIYAPNGTMKTSFALTFKYLCEGDEEELKNKITNETPKYEIRIRNSNNSEDSLEPLTKTKDYEENFYVIESLEKKYDFNHVSKLLINNKLKKRYDKIYSRINKLENQIITKLHNISGISKKEIKETFCFDFNINAENFLECLLKINTKFKKKQYNNLHNIEYIILFNNKTKEIIHNSEIMEKLESFCNQYTKLINESPILNDIFNHNELKKLSDTLSKNGFFDMNHYILLNDKNKSLNNNQTKFYTDKEIIKSAPEIDNKVANEILKIKENETIKKYFDYIDKTLDRNNEVREFRDLIKDNVFLIKELKNENELKKKLWIHYLFNIEEYEDLITEYKNGKTEIEEILIDAKKEHEDWKKVIDVFNNRFITFPFILSIGNQEDIILKNIENLNIEFLPKNNKNSKQSHSDILSFISSGEERAIYILNILFHIEILEKEYESTRKQKLLIFDDIADSFDYQNKYAIIEYLRDISKKEAFNIMILTHNYDFLRSIHHKLEHKQTYIAYKDSEEISFEKLPLHKNILKDWGNEINTDEKIDEKIFLASIPFVRNLLELMRLDKEYNQLTELLHFKGEKTTEKTINDVKDIYKKVNITLELENKLENKKIYNMFEEQSKKIYDENGFKLENKVILSTYIRLKTEEIIIKKLNLDINEFENEGNQTRTLINKFKSSNQYNKDYDKIFERVGLITSDYIHLNSFMYEPLIDTSDDLLKKLYDDLNKIDKN